MAQRSSNLVETEDISSSRTTRKCSKCKRPGEGKENMYHVKWASSQKINLLACFFFID